MSFKKLIGFKLDTNQFTSNTIESESEAKMYVEKVKNLYGLEVPNYMFLTENKRFTTYKKNGISLGDFLKK